ncbi:HET-domain-containing protein, partial [Pyrenochaeta sp. DS3sAY3a]
FKHDPLDYSQGSIRLIRILPSLSADKLIQCEIFHTSINESYQCLSYRWGDAHPEHEILLNGKLFRVRQNLFDFLQLLYSRGAKTLEPSPFLWIDSMCIDQSTTRERNHQVAQMGEIYRSASLVKIWLGKCPRLLQSLRERPVRYVDWGRTHYFTTTRDQLLEEEFFANEYWNRAWITQEIYVAREAVIILENEEFSIRSCIDVLWGCSKLSVHMNPIVKKFALFIGFDDSGLPIIQPGGTSDSLIALLRQFADKHCEIPRDRLYSLLSLHRHGDKVAIDYAQPDDELLVQVVE